MVGDDPLGARYTIDGIKGIPRVYEDELPSYFNPVLDEDKDWIEGGFYEYLKTTRINVNVRKMGVPLESDCSQPK